MKLLLLLLMVSCNAQIPMHSETTEYYKLPEELNSCKVFELDSPKRRNLYVVHCPNSVTTTVWNYQTGKTNQTASITKVSK